MDQCSHFSIFTHIALIFQSLLRIYKYKGVPISFYFPFPHHILLISHISYSIILLLYRPFCPYHRHTRSLYFILYHTLPYFTIYTHLQFDHTTNHSLSHNTIHSTIYCHIAYIAHLAHIAHIATYRTISTYRT